MSTGLEQRTTHYATKEDWLADRCNWIGASEIAAVLGLSEYASSPAQVWLRKVKPDDADPLTGEFIDWGHRAEGMILSRWAEDHPELLVCRDMGTVAHPLFPLIRGTPDAVASSVNGLACGVDAKNLGVHAKHKLGEPGTDELPTDYVIQGLIYCELYDVPIWYFAVLVGGQEYSEYFVERDPATAFRLMGRAVAWWEDYVVTKTCPPLGGSPADENAAKSIWPRVERDEIPATQRAVELARVAKAAAALKKAAEEDEREAKNGLRQLCGEAEGITGVCTWRQSKGRTTTDWQAVAEELALHVPDGHARRVIAKHTTTAEGSRSLRITYTESEG